MHSPRLAFAVLVVLPFLPACPPLACTDLAAVSVSVTVVDSAGDLIDDPGLSVSWATAGDAGACDDLSGQWNCAYEVAGEVTVTATLAPFDPASATVTVGADACHVIGESVTLTIDLDPQT